MGSLLSLFAGVVFGAAFAHARSSPQRDAAQRMLLDAERHLVDARRIRALAVRDMARSKAIMRVACERLGEALRRGETHG